MLSVQVGWTLLEDFMGQYDEFQYQVLYIGLFIKLPYIIHEKGSRSTVCMVVFGC